MLDLAIIGSGPAALSAALYAGRAGLDVHIYGSEQPGGTLCQIDTIANYPGFEGSGQELAEIMHRQATSAGAKFDYGTCQSLHPSADHQSYHLMIDEDSVDARAVLIATGSTPLALDFDVQPPVSYCALCDAPLAKGKHVIVVGGGNSAVQEAIYLAPQVGDLTLITRSELKADAILRRQLEALPNVAIREFTSASPELINTFDYAFVFIGKRPATDFLHSLDTQTVFDGAAGPFALEITKETHLLDDSGYLITGSGKHRTAHQTALPGIFAAGDVRRGAERQAIVAAGDGAAAAIEIIHFLQSQSSSSKR